MRLHFVFIFSEDSELTLSEIDAREMRALDRKMMHLLGTCSHSQPLPLPTSATEFMLLDCETQVARMQSVL